MASRAHYKRVSYPIALFCLSLLCPSEQRVLSAELAFKYWKIGDRFKKPNCESGGNDHAERGKAKEK
jgi:hypothetical protein